MDVFLIIIALVLLMAGFVGCIVPVLPGVPLCYLSLLLLQFTSRVDFSSTFLWVWFGVVVVVQCLDYVMSAWGTKRFGGSRVSAVGSVVGAILGLSFGIVGVVVGTLVGAIVGEMMYSRDMKVAFRAGIGAFVGFAAGVLLKVLACGAMAYYAVKALICS